MGAFSHLKLQISLFYFYPPFVYVEFFFYSIFYIGKHSQQKTFFSQGQRNTIPKDQKMFSRMLH